MAEAPVAMMTLSAVWRGAARGHAEGPRGEVHRLDVHVHDAGAEALRLGAHVGHQLRAVDALGEAREVLHLAR